VVVPQLVRNQNFILELFLFPGHKPVEQGLDLETDLNMSKEAHRDIKASKRME
jgi:hypothetical protein